MNDCINQTSVESFESRKQRITNEFYQKVKQAIEESNDNIYINNRIKKIIAIETVRNNDEIMNIILRNIPNFKDRLHFQLACKHFYSLCNNGRSYLPQFEYERYTKEVVYVQNYNNEFITFIDGTVIFCIPIINDEILLMLNKSKNKIKTTLSIANTLIISRLPNTYFDIFNGIETFINIKVLSLTIEYLNTETIKFFKIFSNLKLHTLYLTILNGDRDLNFDLLISNNDLKISRTIRNMYYQRGRYFLKIVLYLLKSCSLNQLDKLEFPHIGKPNNVNEENLLLNILPYAKNVKFNETISKQEYSSQHFKDFFSGTTIFKNPKVSLKYQINIRFSDAEFGRYYESLSRNSIQSNKENNYQNFETNYISITDLCLGNILFYDIKSKLSDEEVSAFTNDLLKMKNLRSMQTRFLTFSSSNHFSYFCKALNRNLENIKLEKCSDMSIYHLEEIARNCKYLKNLILEEIKSETITLNIINSLFKNLIGLQISFSSCYDVSKIINDLTKIEENGNLKIAWSKLHFLNINCAYPKSNERNILQQLANNTPRRCGQLLIQYLKPSICEKRCVLRIIIQRSTSSCTEFKNSFAKTYLLG